MRHQRFAEFTARSRGPLQLIGRLSGSILAAFALLVAACASPAPTPTPTPTFTPTPTATPLRERPVSLPSDDAPHAEANMEWWYYNGHLTDAANSKYGFHYAVFRVTVPGFPPVHIGHVAISDDQRGAYVQDQLLQLGVQPIPRADHFGFHVNGWIMGGGDGADTLFARVPPIVPEYEFNLAVQATRPPVLHGGTGLVDFGVAGKSYYYSRTRMDLRGTVSVGGQESDVIGLAWFDHQWGNFQPQDIGWDWFALQLDDGTDVMLSLLFGPGHEPLHNYGTVVRADWQQVDLAADQFQVQSTGQWTSTVTGITYPSGWNVVIPQLGMDVAVAPLILASEFDARQTTQNVYWEGDVAVSGSHSGVGYVELTGYRAPPVATPTPLR
ncbi:MAG: hypothetical protein HY533_01225 [Chloroflexi bacterium]|nr:hypothetical protein [Chloroflexota bacterium]